MARSDPGAYLNDIFVIAPTPARRGGWLYENREHLFMVQLADPAARGDVAKLLTDAGDSDAAVRITQIRVKEEIVPTQLAPKHVRDLMARGVLAACFIGWQERLDAAPPTPAPCDTPNEPAAVLRQAAAETPPLAQQQGLAGDVQIVVSLDEQSRVTQAVVRSSPSAVLNNAALYAARRSLYRAEVRN
ncbi:MAG TPA: energy transducer TonB, partial [Candidatus Elarobacter sp.]